MMGFRLWFTVYGCLWLLLFDLVASVDSGASVVDQFRLIGLTVATLVSCFPVELGVEDVGERNGIEGHKRRHPSPGDHRKRKRKFVHDIHDELGPYYTRRAYRMPRSVFWDLHKLLEPHFAKKTRSPKKKHKDGAKNGLITSATRLSVAIRYFAGGRPEDICLTHGISHSEVFNSVWQCVDAVNRCDELGFSFPSDHKVQSDLARAFAKKSQAGFQTCVAAIDGMLLWIERPRDRDCEEAGCGAKKFFCGRKHRFGLNLQGTCDVEGRFLDVDLHHPASTSDFLTFSTSKLYNKLETPGFIKLGLCLFGDAAYVNNRYMATPYKSVSSGTKDAYNFYQSQLRIKIECAFGMLVQRWGILRKAIPSTVGLKKTVSLVICLCRLHNYCINKRLEASGDGDDDVNEDVPAPLAADSLDIAGHGGVDVNRTEELLGGGAHHDDTTEAFVQTSVFS